MSLAVTPPAPLVIDTPPQASDHGLPLGAGLLGATVWGDGAPLKVSLDRGDLWDLRPVPEYQGPDYTWSKVVEAHRAGRHEHLSALLEAPYNRPGPTKLPAGRIELDLGAPALRFSLDRTRALAQVDLADGGRVEAFMAADRPHGRLRFSGEVAIRLAPPPFGGPPPGWTPPTGFSVSKADVWELDYPAPVERRWAEGAAFAQQGWGGFAFAVAVAWTDRAGAREAAWVIETGAEGETAKALLERASGLATAAAAEPFETALTPHVAWWADYWSRGPRASA
jgi:alpha-L-fucosidase 2